MQCWKIHTIDNFCNQKKQWNIHSVFMKINFFNFWHDQWQRSALRCDAKKKFKIFEQLQNLLKIFSKKLFYQLNAHEKIKHSIDFINDKTSRLDFIYNMSQHKLAAIGNYLNDALKKQWICSFFNSINSFVLFTKKWNNDLHFCVNYQNFNEFIIKNKYFLSLLFELLNKFTYAKRFSKTNLQWTYHQIRIHKNNEWKTVFQICYK